MNYRILGNISAGAHGIVLRACAEPPVHPTEQLNTGSFQNTSNSPEVNSRNLRAIKRIFIRRSSQAQNLTLVREIKCLQILCDHEHVTRLLDVFVRGSSVNLVFPLYPTNLNILIYEWALDAYQKKAYLWMALDALHHCHHLSIMHRDVKPSNLLIDWDGRLKLGDFGQARPVLSPQEIEALESNTLDSNPDNDGGWYSHQVCTRWYRAPELLYGATRYDASVDLWSYGCVFVETLQRKPLFLGQSDVEQLCLVHRALGDPPNDWAQKWPDYNKILFSSETDEKKKANIWYEQLHLACQDEHALDIAKKLICYCNRASTGQLRLHKYFEDIRNDGIDRRRLVKPTNVRQVISKQEILT